MDGIVKGATNIPAPPSTVSPNGACNTADLLGQSDSVFKNTVHMGIRNCTNWNGSFAVLSGMASSLYYDI